MPPVLKGEPVSKFDARRERTVERWHRQADEPDERGTADHFDRPQTETAPSPVVADELHRIGTFLVCLLRRKEFADSRIGIERRVWFQILVPPQSEPEA